MLSARSGAASYVFEEPESGWANATQTAELTPSDGKKIDKFGKSVKSLFEEPGPIWANETQAAELTASDGARESLLGWSVALSGDTIVAGSPRHGGSGEGAAYMFEEPGPVWANETQTAELTASDGTFGELGGSVAVSSDTIVAGSGRKGVAYVFGTVQPAPTVTKVSPERVGSRRDVGDHHRHGLRRSERRGIWDGCWENHQSELLHIDHG